MLPTFQQPVAIQSNGISLSHCCSRALLSALPLMLLFAASPALAEAEPATPVGNSHQALSQAPPAATATAENDVAAMSQDATLSPTQPEALSKTDQARATLASPPSSEVAETLCNGTAQSLSNQIVITSQTVCQSGLTPPSLWWTKEQVAQELRTSGKLVNNWSAQLKTTDSPGQVRLVVNPQMWSLMDYFERYDFVNNFGLAARGFGYQTEIYNTKGTPLASYACTTTDGSATLGSSCTMDLRSSLNFGTRRR